MAIRDLPDMYALSPLACGPRALGMRPSGFGHAALGPWACISGKYNHYIYICIYVTVLAKTCLVSTKTEFNFIAAVYKC